MSRRPTGVAAGALLVVLMLPSGCVDQEGQLRDHAAEQLRADVAYFRETMASNLQTRPWTPEGALRILKDSLPTEPKAMIFAERAKSDQATVAAAVRRSIDGYGPGRITAQMQVCVEFAAPAGTRPFSVTAVDTACPPDSTADFTIKLDE